MADFAINVILRGRNEASPAIRQVMGDARMLQRLNGRDGTGPRGRKKKGFFGLEGASLGETTAAVTQLGGAARTAVGAPIELAANFEAAINRVNALSGGTLAAEGKLGAISTKARELGKSTEFTATQAAEGFAVLTQAGFGYEQQLASIGTVLDIATVAQIDMEEAANLTANAIGGFGLKAEDAARVGTTLVRASNASQISIKDLGESFKYAAPGASKLGYDIEEVGTAIAILGRAGLKGSMGGTALRAFFNRLSMVVDKDFATDRQQIAAKKLGLDRESLKKAVESGDLKNVATYMANAMSKSKLSSSQKIAAMQAIFQERGALGAMILMASAGLKEGEGSWTAMEAAVNDTNVTLEKSASIMRSGTKGSATVLKSALEELGITVGEKLLPVITPLIHQATEMAVKFAEWANENPGLVRAMGKVLIVTAALGTTLGPLLLTLGSIRTVLALTKLAGGGAASAIGSVAGASTKANASLGILRAAGLGAAIGIAAAAATVQVFENKLLRIRNLSKELGNDITKNEHAIASELSDEDLAKREEKMRVRAETEQARVEARQKELDDEWGGAKSFVLGAFGANELNTADTSVADTANQQYIALRDERLRRESIAKSKEESITKQAAAKADVTGKITVVIDAKGNQAVRVGKLESGDVPLQVETGMNAPESY